MRWHIVGAFGVVSPSIMNRMRTIGSRKISDASDSDAYAG